MVVLALNCGSSSLKFRVVEMDPRAQASTRRLAEGHVDGLAGGPALVRFRLAGHAEEEARQALDGHEAAVRHVVARLTEARPRVPAIAAAGHRIVHGGNRFQRPTLLDDAALATLEGLGELAPLHNRASLAGIRAARAALGPDVPMVGLFDTAFHADLPDYAARYAIPRELAERHGIRRFGFHGLSYQSVLAQYCRMTSTPVEAATLVALHLGSGCSAAAIHAGRSVDTSMGLTPLEGLAMATRSGDLDPAIVGYLARCERVPIETVEDWLNMRSGLLGLSGLSPDMRALLAHDAGDPAARLAVAVFCYRARKYLGAYLAALGGARAVIFTGGIGENAPEIRARICGGMEWCGLRLDASRNARSVGVPACISPPDAALKAYVIPSDEEEVIARETASLVGELAHHRRA